ncbi:hypothetical protein [Nostoc sp. WHI]|uniref:hypothetical protein n=1 Tax=Nostoc sp. WHI TaxID=2650611 RepID=UPI0018C6A13D|nr:hypothetical protein [Nostoc sp. WHI]
MSALETIGYRAEMRDVKVVHLGSIPNIGIFFFKGVGFWHLQFLKITASPQIP